MALFPTDGTNTNLTAKSFNPISLFNSVIDKVGNRNALAGYEEVQTVAGSQTIDINYADTTVIKTSGKVTLTFKVAAANLTSTKVIALKSVGSTKLRISGARWVNNLPAPEWNSGLLILVATFIAGSVVVAVYHNSQLG